MNYLRKQESGSMVLYFNKRAFLDKTKTLMIRANQTLEKRSHALFTTTTFWVYQKSII